MTEGAFEAMSGMRIPAPPPRLPITTESRFTDLRCSLPGRLIFGAAAGVPELLLRWAMALPEGPERDNRIKGARFMRQILESGSLRSHSMSAGRALPWNLAEGLAEAANGHFLRSLRCVLRPVKAPPLPKERGRRNGF